MDSTINLAADRWPPLGFSRVSWPLLNQDELYSRPIGYRVPSPTRLGETFVSNEKPSGTGRLAGGKSPSYQRAVNEPETRASRFTARYMLASDIAYVLSAAELGATPSKVAAGLLNALLTLYDDVSAIDTSMPLGDVVAQREAWVAERAGPESTAWLH